jgi:hypothetical protein
MEGAEEEGESEGDEEEEEFEETSGQKVGTPLEDSDAAIASSLETGPLLVSAGPSNADYGSTGESLLTGELVAEPELVAEIISPPRRKKDLTVRLGEQADTLIEPPAGTPEDDDTPADDEQEDEADEDETTDPPPPTFRQIFSLLLRPELLTIFLSSSINATLFSGIEPTLPVHLSSVFKAPSSTIGLLFIAIEIPNTLVRLALGPICDTHISGRSRRFLSAFGLCVFGLSAVPMGVITPSMGVGWMIPPLLLFGAMESVYSTPIYSEIANIVRVHGEGEGFGTMCGFEKGELG